MIKPFEHAHPMRLDNKSKEFCVASNSLTLSTSFVQQFVVMSSSLLWTSSILLIVHPLSCWNLYGKTSHELTLWHFASFLWSNQSPSQLGHHLHMLKRANDIIAPLPICVHQPPFSTLHLFVLCVSFSSWCYIRKISTLYKVNHFHEDSNLICLVLCKAMRLCNST